jgi:ABC-type sugar transport system ATPase subunit
MNILYGLYQPDAGQILINGNPVKINSPREAIRHGIGMVHQHFMLVPTLTVSENVALGLPSPKGPVVDLKGVAKKMQAGELNMAEVTMCGHCQAYGKLMMMGAKSEYVQSDLADIVLLTSDNPETVKEIKAFAQRNRDEMAKMEETLIAAVGRVPLLETAPIKKTVNGPEVIRPRPVLDG